MKIKERVRKAHRQSKVNSNSFDRKQYKKLRRDGKKELEVIRKTFYTNRIYRPLKRGNSKPFFKLLKADKKQKTRATGTEGRSKYSDWRSCPMR